MRGVRRMTILASQVVSTARGYLGTPFMHQGRLKGIGVDCIGLLVGVARELGITQHDSTTYSRSPDGTTLCRELNKCLIKECNGRLGMVAVFWISQPSMPVHAGILTDVGMIHTYANVGKVVEHVLDPRWRKRIVCFFRYPGVT